MATEAIEQISDVEAAGAPEAAAPGGTKRLLPILLAVIGIAAGSATGVLVVGPMFAKRRAAAPAPVAAASTEAPVVHALENLVLNPAGTGGTRFLMVTATFECADAAAEQLMRTRDAEMRDRILGLLGKKTVEQLTDMAEREAIKKEVIASVSTLFPKGAIRNLYFPQFVIQ